MIKFNLPLVEQQVLKEELEKLLSTYINRSKQMTTDSLCAMEALNTTLKKCEVLRSILSKIEKD